MLISSNFYPRSPCGERREPTALRTPHQRFLSTLSLRRATSRKSDHLLPTSDFYPRSPCGERPVVPQWDGQNGYISIHALLAESDHLDGLSALAPKQFLSTLSLRRATSQQPRGTTRTTYFYPRSPCGERR